MFTDANANKIAGDIYVMKTDSIVWATGPNVTRGQLQWLVGRGRIDIIWRRNGVERIVRVADNTGFASAAPDRHFWMVDGHATVIKVQERERL